MGTAYSEPSLIEYAYAYEQHTRARLERRAYQDAIPQTQLKNVITTSPVGLISFIDTQWAELCARLQWTRFTSFVC
jgi:hypothetical protein